MRSLFLLRKTLVLGALALGFLSVPSFSEDLSPLWQTDLDKATLLAKEQGKALLIVFR